MNVFVGQKIHTVCRQKYNDPRKIAQNMKRKNKKARSENEWDVSLSEPSLFGMGEEEREEEDVKLGEDDEDAIGYVSKTTAIIPSVGDFSRSLSRRTRAVSLQNENLRDASLTDPLPTAPNDGESALVIKQVREVW